MRKNISTKISALILVLLMLALVALSACDETGSFEYPSMPTGTTVTSNGGLAVTYGEYLYYVNGYQSSNSATNKYTGEVKRGDIVRVELDFLPELFEFYDNHGDDDDYFEELESKVFAAAEVVVPKFYYSNNTSDEANKSVNGLWIFDNKLYFTTPNSDLYTSGTVKNDQLSIYSCDLDGRNLTRVYNFDYDAEKSTNALSTVAAILKASDNNIYTLYIDAEGQLCYANLSGNKTEVVVSKSVTGAKFDVESQSVIFVDNLEYLDEDEQTEANKNPDYKNICSYKLLDDSYKVLVEVKKDDKANETLTIVQTNFVGSVGYVYYTIANSTDGTLSKSGLWMATTANAPVQLINSTNSFSSFLCYQDKIIVVGERAIATPQPIQLYIVSNGDTANVEFIIKPNTNSDAITLNSINGSILSYTLKNVVYTVDLSKATLTSEVNRGSITGEGWYGVDTVVYDSETYFFTLTSSGVSASKYVDDPDNDGEKKTIGISILVVEPVDEE